VILGYLNIIQYEQNIVPPIKQFLYFKLYRNINNNLPKKVKTFFIEICNILF